MSLYLVLGFRVKLSNGIKPRKVLRVMGPYIKYVQLIQTGGLLQWGLRSIRAFAGMLQAGLGLR